MSSFRSTGPAVWSRITQEAYDKLKARADANERPVAAEVRLAIDFYLAAKPSERGAADEPA